MSFSGGSSRSQALSPAVRPGTVRRLLGSVAFGRSRLAASRIHDDAALLRGLAEEVSTKDFGDGPVASRSPDLGAAVALVLGLADEADRTGAAATASPVEQAHQRLVIAALHYLVIEQDVTPDDQPGGSLDDLVILHWVFRAARHELEPYLQLDGHDPR